jgi:hypothetical protein
MSACEVEQISGSGMIGIATHQGHLAYEQNLLSRFLPHTKPLSPLCRSCLLVLGLIEDVGEMASSAVLAVMHGGHEDTGAAL